MEALSFDNILGQQEIEALFAGPEEKSSDNTEENAAEETANENVNDETETTETEDSMELFGDTPQSEGVGSEKNTGEKGDAATDEGSDTSPQNFYSSIAQACAVDGIFPNLDEEVVKKANDAESFSELIEAEINARFDEKQKRISQALENGVEATDIRKYENVLNNLSKLTDKQVAEEGEKGEQLRYNLIFQDFVNKGMSPEKADKFTRRTIDAGTDIEDAKEALQSNREFFQKQYDDLLKKAEEDSAARKAEDKKEAEKLKESILKDKNLLGDIELSSEMRKKVFDNIARPVYRDPETGDYLTALQRYEQEHHLDFIKYVGLFMTLTNGFKDFDSFTKGKVKKEMKKGMRELEQTLSGTKRAADGSLRQVAHRGDDPESYVGGNFRIAL